MRVLVCVPSNPEAAAGALPPKELLEKMSKFNAELAEAGVLVSLGGLQPLSKSVRLSFSNGKARTLDGPFTESKEVIAGFWLLEVKSLEDAVAWIAKAPFDGGAEITLRPLHDLEEWPEELRKAAGV